MPRISLKGPVRFLDIAVSKRDFDWKYQGVQREFDQKKTNKSPSWSKPYNNISLLLLSYKLFLFRMTVDGLSLSYPN